MEVNNNNNGSSSSSHNMSTTSNNGGNQFALRYKQLIPGIRFLPTEQHLISYYLRKKVTNTFSVPCDNIPVVDLYNYHPRQLTAKYEVLRGEDWYFFTQRNRKYPKGCRPDRSAANGYWKPVGKDKTIREIDDEQGEEVGRRKSLDYYEGKHPDGTRTEWKMHEYTLIAHHPNIHPPPPENYASSSKDAMPMRMEEWVLCRIYKNMRDCRASTSSGHQIEEVVSDSPSSAADQHPDDHESINHSNYSQSTGTSQQLSFSDMVIGDQAGMVWPSSDYYSRPNHVYDISSLFNQGENVSSRMMQWNEWNNSWPNDTFFDVPDSIAYPQNLPRI